MQIEQKSSDEYLVQLLAKLVEELESKEDYSVEDVSENPEVMFVCQIGQVCYTISRQIPVMNHVEISLSPREQEIARLVTEGASNKEIAHILEISPYTVATHLRRVFTKLGVGTRAEMVASVLREDRLISQQEQPIVYHHDQLLPHLETAVIG